MAHSSRDRGGVQRTSLSEVRYETGGFGSIHSDAAAGNPAVYVQARAGHAQATLTERYVHAAQVVFPGATERAEERLFAGVDD